MSSAPEAVNVEIANAPSKKRQVTATVTAAAVTIALGLVANALIEKAANRVKKQINPETESE